MARAAPAVALAAAGRGRRCCCRRAGAFRSPLGRIPGVALLTAFLALKLLEARTPRDGYVVVLLCYFMQLAQFFANQSIATAGLTLLGTVVTTATLTTLNSERLGIHRSGCACRA